uniref:Si:ch211-241e1.3 n=1 Tax=Oryzias melastigma TaxID=30732 RepID=A0A3B3BCN8_ORYME
MSFQKCSPGFYRDAIGPYLGRCVPCECNGLAFECEDKTGRCLNCQYNTAGDRCEHCKEGYYGNAALRTCRACPCPFSNSGNREVNGIVNCVCKPGYSGGRCERCAAGYFGDPMSPGGRCQPCNCNGNSNNCDPRTGDLLNQMKTEEGRGDSLPSESLLSMLEKAQRMLKEMEERNFAPQKTVEYETLAAQLDGAKTDLTAKVKEITNAAAKKNIVEAAEEHANNLAKLAKDMENALKNASGRAEVRDARDAIEAYQNITDAINAAEAAANEAKEAADDALNVLDVLFIHKAKDLKQTGNDLLNGAQDAEKQLQALQKDLRDVQATLKDTKRDDIKKMIEEAKKKAASANETSTKTAEKLNNITNEINKIKISPSHSNLSNELKDVNQSVNQLINIIPSLNDKIAEVENVTTRFPPINNISDSIKNVKDLIEQARDAANRITVPMKFKGDGYVELRPPKDLDDLKAYTSLSLKLQRAQGRGDGRRRRRQAADIDMFVMYLGNRDSSKNYIGMVVRNSILYTVYKLNGVEYELKSSYVIRSTSEPAKFDRVDLHRSIYQDAEIIYTSDVTSNTPGLPVRANSQGAQSKNLLNIMPGDVVFYVGGYPANFTPPVSLKLPKYQGCIEFISFNNKVMSLYNFQKAEKINPEIPCKRYLPPVDIDYYEGTGYGKVILTQKLNTLLPLLSFLQVTDWTDIEIVIMSESEILMRVGNKLAFPVSVKFDTQEFKEFYVGGIPQELREKNNITMLPYFGCLKNLKVSTKFQDLNEQIGLFKLIVREAQFSLGSSLSSDLPGFSLDGDFSLSLGFKNKEPEGLILQDNLGLENGYVILAVNDKVLKSNNQYKDGEWHYLTVTRNAGKQQSELQPSTASPAAQVRSSGSRANTSIRTVKSLTGVMCLCLCRPHFSLDVRTRSAEGLLFFAATRRGRSHLVLYMSKGRIRLSVGKQKEIFNREKYNDGKWHSVIFTFEKRKFRLVVDGIRAQDGQLTNDELKSMQEFISPVFLGSAPGSFHKELKDLPKHSVSGCLRNFKMNGALMSNPTTNTGAGPCFEGQTQRGVYFSGNGAHVILNDSFTVRSTFELLFNIRPRSQTGLLLYVGDSGRTQSGPATGQFLTVYMLKGEVVAKVDNGKGEFMVSVKPKASLCDGAFHKISVIKRMHVVQLSVDTMDNYKIGPPTSTPILTKGPLYLGGIPGECPENTQPSFIKG